MLTVINPEIGTIYFMDPLKRRLINGEWRDVVDTAIGLFKADRIKKGRGSIEWKNMTGIPPQPNDKECGYFVIRYMRESSMIQLCHLQISGVREQTILMVKWNLMKCVMRLQIM